MPRELKVSLLDQLDAIQGGSGSGVINLPGGDRLEVTNLQKPFWPQLKLTKGDLFRHYVRVAPYILPVLENRPLVMKRYPNGVAANPFYQHRAPEGSFAGAASQQSGPVSHVGLEPAFARHHAPK